MNENEKARYKFVGRATGVDPEGYYVTRWDLAEAVSVIASTKTEATQKACEILGTHPQFGSWRTPNSGWGIKWDSIEEVPAAAEEVSA